MNTGAIYDVHGEFYLLESGPWATLACAAVAVAIIFENRADLAKFIREPSIKSLSLGTILVLLTTVSVALMALAFLVSF
jgi:hypothetical protein